MEVRKTLVKRLEAGIMAGLANDVPSLEGLFLKLALEGGADLSDDVVSKLVLEECHVNQLQPEHLMSLSRQLGQRNRGADGALVAAVAAKALAASGKEKESENAYLMAFAMDNSNKDAAEGVAEAVRSAHRRCEALEARTHCEPRPRLELGSSWVWDLSIYDFSKVAKGQVQRSEPFQLPNGINAWLSLCPKGYFDSSEGMAALFLFVCKPAIVRLTWQSASGRAKSMEHDFSSDLDEDGHPRRWGDANFMPISETNGSITLRILSIQSAGFKLKANSESSCFAGLRWLW